MLSLPIDSTQFQQFCKELNDKELFSMQRSSRKRNLWQVEVQF